jgi:hypothetical protein
MTECLSAPQRRFLSAKNPNDLELIALRRGVSTIYTYVCYYAIAIVIYAIVIALSVSSIALSVIALNAIALRHSVIYSYIYFTKSKVNITQEACLQSLNYSLRNNSSKKIPSQKPSDMLRGFSPRVLCPT